jgi:hypothetical protein
VVADLEKFMASPLAEQQQWNERSPTKAPLSAPPLPSRPGLKRIYLSAQLDLQTMDPNWEAALITLDREVKMKTIATGTGGYLDSVGDREAAFTTAAPGCSSGSRTSFSARCSPATVSSRSSGCSNRTRSRPRPQDRFRLTSRVPRR